MSIEIELTLWDRAGTTMLAILDDAFDIQWQSALNDVGVGKFSLPMADPSVLLLQPGYLVRCNYRETMAVFAFRIEQVTWVRVSSDEEMGQIIEVSGRSRNSRLADAVVYPPYGVNQRPLIENRSFSFASVEYDATSWVNAAMMATQGDLNAPWKDVIDGTLQAAPFGWPTNLPYSTYWIWEPGASEAVGNCYFRQIFWLGTTEEVTIIATADNFWTLYLDGVALLGDNTNPSCWREHRKWTGQLGPGPHLLAAVVRNILPSPAGFLCAVYIEHEPSCDQADPPNCVEVPPTVIVVSDLYWKCLGFPANEPGFSPGSFALQLYNEARSRGQLLDIEPTFNATTDSSGASWPIMPEFGANIGDSIFDVLQGLSNGYWIDWDLSHNDYLVGGLEIPGQPTGSDPPPPVEPPPNVPSVIWYERIFDITGEFTFMVWDDYSIIAGQSLTFDIAYQPLTTGSDLVILVTDQAEGAIGNAVGKTTPVGVTIPVHGGGCWSDETTGTAIQMFVRAKWTVGIAVYTSEWVTWATPR